ncbi:uncharacterized protein cubi_03446 [Cryptosporidium ubiquitum]|uniref:Uncharacterized protein n=1 Tax=Cryptosporidium ubiquitum TaxID=857276 RepID=A0A1J4MHG0_9CRYT|nr:uncharacterized protein cubi_03446 [Cryptosporidium ubiquitum]OII73648.1 hypothetical protein cubi_03446 [Cryptosporidium ubiquitum]
MDELHPLFRSDVPSTNELRSNDIYSALVEISTQKSQNTSKNNARFHSSKADKNLSEVSVISKSINKKYNCEKHIKSRYKRHLNKIKATKLNMEQEKRQEIPDNISTEDHSNTNDINNDKEEREFAEMELCMSIWSSKNVLSG